MSSPAFAPSPADGLARLARDVKRGLGARPRWMPPKYFHDDTGPLLFERITRLPEANRGVDGDFDPDAFRHEAFYNDAASRIEMHLVATAPQRVRLRRLELVLDFREGDGIWTESSYKFTRASIDAVLGQAGLLTEAWLTDANERFALVLAGAAGG